MSTALAIPANLPPPPIGEILEPEAKPIHEYHLKLVEAARNMRVSSAWIAYFGWRMKLTDGWTEMGFESGPRGEESYRKSLGIPESTWYKHLRIGQALHQLPLPELERIPTTNRELLTQVDASLLHDFNWVHEAKTLQPEELAERVASRNKTVGGKEPLATMVFKVAFLAKSAMETMLEKVQTKYELSSKGQALELMIADLHNDANLISSVSQAQQLLGGVAQSMKARGATDTDEARWLQMAMEVLDEGYEKAVQAARQKTACGQKNGGRA